MEATLELWASSLREVKARIRPLYTQERVAASAGLFLDGLLGPERRKRRATVARGGSRRSRGGAGGMLMPCVTSYGIMPWKHWLSRMRRWWLMKPVFSSKAKPVVAWHGNI